MENRISFSSKINFVNRHTFDILTEEMTKYIRHDLDAPIYVEGEQFFTKNIRTCTAGTITNRQDKARGFHWLDDLENYLNIDRLCSCLFRNLDNLTEFNGLIVGGKHLIGRNNYSLLNFESIKTQFSKFKQLSMFQEHKNLYGETNFFYNLADDTFTLCTGFIDKNGKYKNVTDIQSLKENFRSIKIADKDKLFINGQECSL